MKKEEILKVFADNGIEIAEDKQSAILGELNRLSGLDVTNAKKDYESLNAELLKYKEGGELYIDREEFEKLKKINTEDLKELENLRKYKAETEAKLTADVRNENILKMLDGKFDKTAINLLKLAVKEKAEFADDNSIKNGEELLKELQETYKDFVVTAEVDGAKPSVVDNKTPERQPTNLKEALADFYKSE